MSDDKLTQLLLSDDDLDALVHVTDTADDVVQSDYAATGLLLEELDADVETAYDILSINRQLRRELLAKRRKELFDDE